jgi:RNA polymerase sigma factor (sigma-70 family)
MPRTLFRDLLYLLRRQGASAEGQPLTDGMLLQRFLDQRDEAAFQVLLERHGPMVLGVCRRVLGDTHLAEDALQATFFVLARRAGAIRKQASLASWLFGVAQRIAAKARAQSAARRDRERRAATMPQNEPLDELTWQELRTVLDEEIGRLPDQCRAALVLCHLEGKSQEQAAQELGWPKGTLARRLGKAQALLRGQLSRRGMALSAAALATALTEKATAAPLTALLALNIVKAAASVAAGKNVAAGILSTQALALAEETMKGMSAMKGKLLLGILACGLVVGLGWAGYYGLAGSDGGPGTPPPKIAATPPQDKAADGPKKDLHGDPLPAGAVARMGQNRWLHGLSANFAAILPDGKTAVTVNTDGTIRLWEYPAGKEIRRIEPPGPVHTLGGSGPSFVSAALTRDGKTLARSVAGGEIVLHDLVSGKELPQRLQIPSEKGSLTRKYVQLVFSPDGAQLAGLTGDGILKIWDWRTGKQLHSVVADGPSGFGGGIPRFLAYAPDGKLLATQNLNEDGLVIKLWDPTTGIEKRSIRFEAIDKSRGLALAFSPDSKILALVTAQSVTLQDAASGKELGKFKGELRPGTAIFGNDGTKLYIFGADLIVEWDVASGKVLRTCPAISPPIPMGAELALAPDGNTLVLAGRGPQFFALGGKDIVALNKLTLPLVALQFMADGKTFLTGKGSHGGLLDGVRLWDAGTGKDLGAGKWFPPGFSALSPDGKVGVSVSLQGAKGSSPVILFDPGTGKETGQITLHEKELGVLLRFSPDSKVLAISQPVKQKLELYEVPSGKWQRTLDVKPSAGKGGAGFVAPSPPQGLAFSADGKTLAWCQPAVSSTLVLLDTATGQRIGQLTLPPLTNPPKGTFGGPAKLWPPGLHLAFSADGRCLAVDLEDGTVALYELAAGQARFTFGKKTAGRERRCFAFSPDGKILALSGADGIIRLVDLQSGKEWDRFQGHTEGVNAVAFAPDGQTLASASDDSTALIWDVTKVQRPVPPVKALKPADLEQCWQALAEQDAEKAWPPATDLVAAPREAVPFLRDRLKPAAPVDARRVQELLGQVDDPQFKVRDPAIKELLKLGEQIVPALDKALAAQPPLETRQRLEELRGKLAGLLLEGERLRAYRAVEVLELIGTAEARAVLQALAEGAPDALLTRSARVALKR